MRPSQGKRSGFQDKKIHRNTLYYILNSQCIAAYNVLEKIFSEEVYLTIFVPIALKIDLRNLL
jgi:hypothetical protein